VSEMKLPCSVTSLVYVDDSRWEYANINIEARSLMFPIRQTGEIILTWRGIKPFAEMAWVMAGASRLFERLITAKSSHGVFNRNCTGR